MYNLSPMKKLHGTNPQNETNWKSPPCQKSGSKKTGHKKKTVTKCCSSLISFFFLERFIFSLKVLLKFWAYLASKHYRQSSLHTGGIVVKWLAHQSGYYEFESIFWQFCAPYFAQLNILNWKSKVLVRPPQGTYSRRHREKWERE